MIRRLVVHPFLLAAYPILLVYSNNVSEVRPTDLIGPIALVLGVTGLIWGLGYGLLRDARKSGLLASLAAVLFFGLNRTLEVVNRVAYYASTFWVANDRGVPAYLVFAGMAILGAIAGYVLVRKLPDLGPLTLGLNVFSIALVLFPVARIVTARPPIPAPVKVRDNWKPEPIARLPEPESRPDIYYIVLDSYARRDVMKALFDFDIQPFLDHLERKGFYIAKHATANYIQTRLCLPCSLNGQYLDRMVRDLNYDHTELARRIGQNRVVAALQPLGYKYISFSSGFEETENPGADLYLTPSRLPFTAFQRLLISTTPFGSLIPVPRVLDRFEAIRERVLYQLDHLPDVAEDPESTFTFAHFMCPHPPFLFRADGEDIRERDRSHYEHEGMKFNGLTDRKDVYYRGYRDQALFITRKIQRTIDRILENSKTPPIIILHADHGSAMNFDFHSLAGSDLLERLSILSTYYFPDRRYEKLYDSISPVNSFRVVLNTFFGAKLDLLPDKSFYSTANEPYDFHEVTEQVAGKEYQPLSAAQRAASRLPAAPSERSDRPAAVIPSSTAEKPVGGDARSDDSQSGD
jgi:hypothetical protein